MIYHIFTKYIHLKSYWKLLISYDDLISNIIKGPEADCHVMLL